MTPREYFAAVAQAVIADLPAPELPPKRARPLPAPRKRRASGARSAARADALERLTARASRGASAAGEPFRPIRGIPARTWAMTRAVVRDTSGRTALSALATLPITVRARARAELAPTARDLATRYRVALLVGLHHLSRPHRSKRRASRVVEGFARDALCALLRSPATGERLSVSRVYGRRINGAPILPWLVDRKLIAPEQPGIGARNVIRGPSGHALNVYYVDGDPELAPVESARSIDRTSSSWSRLADLIPAPPD